ncbi:hypothetical protein SSBR45G_65250 [Bradyrhizobium sp. SSBR45G]|uniref:hypothetical protein n=1 Tax=unclassified Bradyrhizobium TaxID=2631580 RepID=UPI002342B597|nr:MULTISPECIES: hypothetical protein [unclassified Bradyrhizobium]GLH81616.1 hypothetical protein SSBR45G_65250 [Bradyrhizobium sp. SSBR45G]GLH88244.1 hypothetical protein SSBR45R_57050 [Bradyrhizobium sp. SSBR45R]
MQAIAQTFYRVPVIGWMTREAVHGPADAKYFFAFNLVVLFAALVYTFGYPFLISVALFEAAAGLAFLVVLTASDAFTKQRAPAPDPTLRAPRKRG